MPSEEEPETFAGTPQQAVEDEGVAGTDVYNIPDPPLPDDVPGGSTVPIGAEDHTNWTDEDYKWHIEEEQEAQRIARLDEARLPHSAKTAFVVILNENGEWGWSWDVEAAKDIKLERAASDGDVWHGGRTVSENSQHWLVITNVVTNVMNNLDMRAQMAMQQAQAQQIARQAGLVDGRGMPGMSRDQRRHPGGG